MTSAGSVHSIDFLIGRPVLSRATANGLGQTHDLLVDPARGVLAGLCVCCRTRRCGWLITVRFSASARTP